MKILAIETSCDETAAAVIEGSGELTSTGLCFGEIGKAQVRILSNVVVSQVDIFAAYGGVIPEVAARSHLEAMLPVVDKALADAGVTKDEIDAIAVTHAPGLLGSLLIGTLTARTLAILWGKPLYAVHHLKSHIYANWLSGEAPAFPLVALVVSGGHTQLIYMREHNHFEIIGTTRDDAVGECFDKVAKILGLPYPGGPSIAKCAEQELSALSGDVSLALVVTRLAHFMLGRSLRTPPREPKALALPIPQVPGLDFSFSGLKTAVLRAVQAELGVPISTPSHELAGKLTEVQQRRFAASFQETAVEILLEKLEKALQGHQEARSAVLAGGVSANALLRQKASERILEASEGKIRVYYPEPRFAGDNAAMVGAAAYFEILSGVQPTDPYKLNIAPRTPIQ